MALDHLKKRIKNINTKYPWSTKPNVLCLLITYAFHVLFLDYCINIPHMVFSCQNIKPMSKLLLEKKNEPNEPPTSHECMIRFLKSVQSQVLLIQPVADGTASTLIASCLQDTIEKTDFTDDSVPILHQQFHQNPDHDPNHKDLKGYHS